MDRNGWYEKASEKILDNLEDFYDKFYGDYQLKTIGKGSFRLEPCPICNGGGCTIGIAVHCFSCKWSGSHIKCCKEYLLRVKKVDEETSLVEIGKFLEIPYPIGTPEEIEAYRKRQREQTIKRTAETFYHNQLLNCTQIFDFKGSELTPMDYLLETRGREEDTVKALKIGFTSDYLSLREELMQAGFSESEIKEAKVWMPEGLFVFFYKHPITKDIVRINTKNPFNVKHRSFDSQGKSLEGEVIQGFSVGSKAFLFSPDFDFKKPFGVVEGEHDLASLIENGCENACCIGGNPPEGLMGKVFEKAQDKIYTMFDNDKVGEEYLEVMNEELPHKDIYKIEYPSVYKDPDEYYTTDGKAKPYSELVPKAQRLETKSFKVERIGNVWVSGNRHKKLEFTITGKLKDNTPTGTIMYYVDGEFADREDNTSIFKAKLKMKALTNPLIVAMAAYYDSGHEEKSTEELARIHCYAVHSKGAIITLLAKRVLEAKDQAVIIEEIRSGFSKTRRHYEDEVDAILKEVNTLRNKRVEGQLYPKMKLGQYFNILNNDAYFYFTTVKADGDTLRAIPYLLRNDKTLIRLDLYKKKDPQCVLLLDNKYELPSEVKTAMFDKGCTLVQGAVEKYIRGEYTKEDLSPHNLLKELEYYYKKFYHTEDINIYKIIALWTLGTYCYSLLGEYPYLHISGAKGSGKSALGYPLEMLSFNARKSISSSDAAVFHACDSEGGTMILDEIEGLTTVKAGVENLIGSILKGGYKERQYVERYDAELKCTVRYDIFSPKILLNILGLDYIIGDRCLKITSFSLDMTKGIKIEQAKEYWDMHLPEVRDLTSRISFCMLENFNAIRNIHISTKFIASTARLSEIISPLYTIAKFADLDKLDEFLQGNPGAKPEDYKGEYEQACINFYELYIKTKKEEAEAGSPEGCLKEIFKEIALECTGLTDRREYFENNEYVYRDPIKFNNDEGWFEVNSVHIKVFMQANNPGEVYYVRNISRHLEQILKISEERKALFRRVIVKIDNEELIKELKGSRSRVNCYRVYYHECLPEAILSKRIKTDSSVIPDPIPGQVF